eukprot:1144811-Pleurochrysis_carterae.AAC.3
MVESHNSSVRAHGWARKRLLASNRQPLSVILRWIFSPSFGSCVFAYAKETLFGFGKPRKSQSKFRVGVQLRSGQTCESKMRIA